MSYKILSSKQYNPQGSTTRFFFILISNNVTGKSEIIAVKDLHSYSSTEEMNKDILPIIEDANKIAAKTNCQVRFINVSTQKDLSGNGINKEEIENWSRKMQIPASPETNHKAKAENKSSQTISLKSWRDIDLIMNKEIFPSLKDFYFAVIFPSETLLSLPNELKEIIRVREALFQSIKERGKVDLVRVLPPKWKEARNLTGNYMLREDLISLELMKDVFEMFSLDYPGSPFFISAIPVSDLFIQEITVKVEDLRVPYCTIFQQYLPKKYVLNIREPFPYTGLGFTANLIQVYRLLQPTELEQKSLLSFKEFQGNI